MNVINILNSRKPIVAAKLVNDSGTTEAAKFDWITNNPAITGQITNPELGSTLQFALGPSPNTFFDISSSLSSSGSFALTASEMAARSGTPLDDGAKVITLHLLKSGSSGRICG